MKLSSLYYEVVFIIIKAFINFLNNNVFLMSNNFMIYNGFTTLYFEI